MENQEFNQEFEINAQTAQPEPPQSQPAQPQQQPTAPAPAPTPAVSAAPAATPVQTAPAPAPSPVAEPVRERRTRASRTGAGPMSVKAMMEEAPAAAASAAAGSQPAPEDDEIRKKWPELAAKYGDKPRLASMLSSSSLTIEEADGAKTVTFRVVNDAQKEWVESKLLHVLETDFRSLLNSAKVSLRVAVIPAGNVEQKVYMPGDQARELMSKNEEVRNLVQDFALDIK